MNDTVLVSGNPQRSSDSILPRAARMRLAGLAFGSGSARASMAISSAGLDLGKHLAYLPDEALDLDLSDPAQRRFGDYELLELIGQGGMGVVYRARQVSLDREVAVKLLSAGPWASHDFIERFQSEAQNAARMQHPNIVPIHEVGAVEGLHFFSMRLVRGTSLGQQIRFGQGPTPQRAAALLRTIAEAVDYAHRLGVLHLDLKPANVLIDESGEPHVADFGLARRIDQSGAEDRTEISGTPSYMSPEQATPGRAITSAADIWGLGAIGYELVTGHVPFEGDTAHAVLNLVVQGNLRRPREVVPLLSRDFEAIILKCMARDPADRYRSARDLSDDLGRLLENRPVRARPLNRLQRTARWVRRQPYVATFAVLFVLSLLAGIVGVGAQWRRAEANVDLAQHRLWESRDATLQRQILDGDAYRALDGALANVREMEDRGAVASAALERLRIGTVLANAPRLIDAIALGADVDQLEFAPDGKVLAALTGSVVHLFDVASGAERWSIDLAPFGGSGAVRGVTKVLIHISEDGQRLIADFPAAASTHRVTGVMIDVGRGEVVEPPAEFADLVACKYSPDGGSALLFDGHGRGQVWRVSPWSAAGSLVDLRTSGPLAAGDMFDEAIPSDDGEVVVAVYEHSRSLRILDPQRLTPKRDLSLTTQQGMLSNWMLSHDGRRLAAGTRSGQLLLWNLADGDVRWLRTAGGKAGNVPFQSGTIVRMSFSSDDSRFLAVSYQPSELRVFDAQTGELVVAPISLGETGSGGAGFGNAGRTVWVRSPVGGARVWNLPETNVWPLSATPAMPSFPGEQTRFTMARDPMPRLLAHADNGMIKLWRSPPPPLGGRVAAPLVADALRVRGGMLVGTAGNRIEVFDAQTQAGLGVPIDLEQPPTFADLTEDGKTVVAIAGRHLSAWDWRTGAARWPAYTLGNSPAHVSLAANAPVIAVSTSESSSDAAEVVHIVDLTTGAARGDPIKFRWQQFAPRLSADGRRLLAFVASDVAETEPTVLSVIEVADPDHPMKLSQQAKEGASVGDARFADDGSIWSIISGGDDLLSHWSARGELLLSKHLPTTRNHYVGMLLPLPAGRGVIVVDTSSGSAALLVGPDGGSRPLPGPAPLELLNIAALGADGRMLAIAMRNGVVLVDVENAQRLLPDLRFALPAHDSIQQLAFASTGNLVGRTVYGRWFQWQVRADLRPVAEIDRDLRLRHFERSVDPSAPLAAEERRRLRADDPGPAPTDTGVTADTKVTPAPTASGDGRYLPLDLTPIANLDPRLVIKGWPPGLPTLPRGLQRYGGVDFQLGGGLQLAGGSPGNAFEFSYPRQSKVLDLRPQFVSAIDLLAFQFDAFDGELAYAILHYADGGERELPILQGRDILYQSDEPDSPSSPARRHVGWQGIWAANFAGNAGFNLGEAAIWWSYVVRLENPEPQRQVTGISFGTKADSPGMLVLALTVEAGAAPD